ncbi:uncharacterized protein LOC120335396 [Styela clava]
MINISIFLLLTLTIIGVKTKQCRLPEPVNDFDWDKISGVWYQILNAGDVLDRVVSCFIASEFESTKSGGKFRFFAIRENESTKYYEMPFHYFHRGLNIYFRNRTEDKVFLREMDIDLENHHLQNSQEAKKEVDSHYEHPERYYSDYSSFIIIPLCGEEDDHYIFIFSHDPHPSAETILKITNFIKEMGEQWAGVSLYLSGCTRMKKFPSLY